MNAPLRIYPPLHSLFMCRVQDILPQLRHGGHLSPSEVVPCLPHEGSLLEATDRGAPHRPFTWNAVVYRRLIMSTDSSSHPFTLLPFARPWPSPLVLLLSMPYSHLHATASSPLVCVLLPRDALVDGSLPDFLAGLHPCVPPSASQISPTSFGCGSWTASP